MAVDPAIAIELFAGLWAVICLLAGVLVTETLLRQASTPRTAGHGSVARSRPRVT